MQIAGKPDLYSPKVFVPMYEQTSCDNIDYITPAKLAWALQIVAQYPDIKPEHVVPENIKHLCFDIDHADPDTQPKADGA